MTADKQPTGTAQMSLLDDTCASFDKHLSEAFGIGHELHANNGVLKKNTNPWKNPWYAFWSDIPTCFMSACGLGPCVYGCVRSRFMGKSENEFLPEALAVCLCPGFHASTRTMMRKKYDLEGSVLTDLLITGCCTTCALVQEKTEMNDREGNALMTPPPATVATTAGVVQSQESKVEVTKEESKMEVTKESKVEVTEEVS